MENGAKMFHEALPKKKFPSFKNIGKAVTVQKNNKQCIVKVKRDILSWLANLSASSGLVLNYKKAIKLFITSVPLSIATTEGGRRHTPKSKLLEIVTVL